MSVAIEAVARMYSVKNKHLEKIFTKFTEKLLNWILFFNKAGTWDLQLYWKRDSNTDIFLWILWNFWKNFFIEHFQWLLLHVGFFKLKLTYGLHFSLDNFLAGVLKIYIANKNLLIQTEKIEHILPVLLKKRKQMWEESEQRTRLQVKQNRI